MLNPEAIPVPKNPEFNFKKTKAYKAIIVRRLVYQRLGGKCFKCGETIIMNYFKFVRIYCSIKDISHYRHFLPKHNHC